MRTPSAGSGDIVTMLEVFLKTNLRLDIWDPNGPAYWAAARDVRDEMVALQNILPQFRTAQSSNDLMRVALRLHNTFNRAANLGPHVRRASPRVASANRLSPSYSTTTRAPVSPGGHTKGDQEAHRQQDGRQEDEAARPRRPPQRRRGAQHRLVRRQQEDQLMTLHLLVDLLTSVPTPSPSPTIGTSDGGDTTTTSSPPVWVPYLTLIAAALAAGVALFAAVLQRRSGKESAAAAQESAAAAKKSSEASQRSAQAAEDSVALNADTARATAARLDSEALAKRFQDAASQLGNANAAIRLAGVYSMARLADDWQDQRQTCVDVLCAYVRMRAKMMTHHEGDYPIDLPDDGDMQVRHTVSDLIRPGLPARTRSGRRATSTSLTPTWSTSNCETRPSAAASSSTAHHRGKLSVHPHYLRGRFGCQGAPDQGDAQAHRRSARTAKTVSLTESYIADSGTLEFVLTKPVPATNSGRCGRTRSFVGASSFSRSPRPPTSRRRSTSPGCSSSPRRARIIQTPASEADSFEVPEDRSEGMVNDCLREDRDTRVDPKEAHLQSVRVDRRSATQFEYAYVTPPDIDAILGLDDNDA